MFRGSVGISFDLYVESRWHNSHVLVYHGPLLNHNLGVAIAIDPFTTVYGL